MRGLERRARHLEKALRKTDTGDPNERFAASLNAARDAFKKRRNVDRYEAHLVDADLGFLQRFARAVQKTLYGRAPEARKATARTGSGTSGDNRTSRKHPANLSCSFCGKGQSQVRKLIAGPAVHICDECVLLFSEIICYPVATRSADPEDEGRNPGRQPPEFRPSELERETGFEPATLSLGS